MKKLLKILLGLGLVLALVVAGLVFGSGLWLSHRDRRARATLVDEVPALIVDGMSFRDLNKNGRLDAYEDRRAATEERIADLLGQMTLEEKVGLWFHTFIGVGGNGEVVDRPGPMSPMATSEAVITRHLRHFNLFETPGPVLLAQWHNAVQDMAARTRLGIPVMISSDLRHGTGESSGVAIPATGFSQWPEPVGLAATRDAGLLGLFGVTDDVLLDAVFGRFSPAGKLPFELPSSMEAVRNQKEDVPYDSEGPLFPFGWGLTYEEPPQEPAADAESS
jgi:beta-glucosidase